MAAYYNEIDPFAAQWLRNLIKQGLIADGEVDERSIRNVSADDLAGFAQCHFFAGIGGWSLAARLAGWADDRPLWTGSCPCQPFSVAGKGKGTADDRHLWPDFFRLIAARRPPVVMGEQVSGAAGYGWLDGVVADLETENYASGAVDIPACAVDAPHIRQRLYWVARALDNADDARLERHAGNGSRWEGRPRAAGSIAETSCGDVADADKSGRRWRASNGLGVLDGSNARRSQDQRDAAGSRDHRDGDVADANHERRQGVDLLLRPDADGRDAQSLSKVAGRGGSFWSDHIWLAGADGKARRAEPGLPLLAHGLSGRVGRLRAYGNAIVPPLAAEVIAAFMDAEPQ